MYSVMDHGNGPDEGLPVCQHTHHAAVLKHSCTLHSALLLVFVHLLILLFNTLRIHSELCQAMIDKHIAMPRPIKGPPRSSRARGGTMADSESLHLRAHFISRHSETSDWHRASTFRTASHSASRQPPAQPPSNQLQGRTEHHSHRPALAAAACSAERSRLEAGSTSLCS